MDQTQDTIKRLEEENASLKRDLEIESRIAFERLTRIDKAEELLRLVPMMAPGALPADFETLIKEFLEARYRSS